MLNRPYDKSNLILFTCERYLNDYDVQMLIGDNYLKLHDFAHAADRFNLAADMCPNRFMPLFNLFLTYKKSNQLNKAKQIAESIMHKPIKIPSRTIEDIKKIIHTELTTTTSE